MHFRVDAMYKTPGQRSAMEGLSLLITLAYQERKCIFQPEHTAMRGQMHLADGARELTEGKVPHLLQKVKMYYLFLSVKEK